jgi:hypothetical protein
MGRPSEICQNNIAADNADYADPELSWRPTEHPAAKQVQVDVVDGLPSAGIHIEDGAVALLMDVGLRRKFLRDLKHLTNKCVVFRR